MKKIILATLFFICSTNTAFAGIEKDITVSIDQVGIQRTHSITHNSTAVRHVYLVWVSGLSDGCNKLFVNADKDPYLFSSVLSGLKPGSANTVQFFYHIDDSLRSQWGDNTACPMTSFTVIN